MHGISLRLRMCIALALMAVVMLVIGSMLMTVPLLLGCADVPERPTYAPSAAAAAPEQPPFAWTEDVTTKHTAARPTVATRPQTEAGPELQLRRIDRKFQRLLDAEKDPTHQHR